MRKLNKKQKELLKATGAKSVYEIYYTDLYAKINEINCIARSDPK